jgi:zinc protease
MLMSKSAIAQSSKTTETALKNGAVLLHTLQKTAPRIAISFFVRGGNLLEAKAGLSDLIDQLILKGTAKRTQEQISIELDGLTLELDTEARRDYAVFHAKLLEEDLETSFELISDIFYNATFADMEREKQKLVGEITMSLDSPKSRASDQFYRKVFENTPYGRVDSVVLESLEHIKGVSELKDYAQAVFSPENLVISCVGNIEQKQVIALVEKYFSQKGKDVLHPEAQLEKQLKELAFKADEKITFPRDDSSQAHIFRGWLVPHSRHEDYAAISMLNTILGAAGLSSRLFLELRDKQGLAYNVRSNYESFRYRGLFSLYIGTEPKNIQKCLKGFQEEIDKLINIPVSEKELADAKRNLLGRRAIMLETAGRQAAFIGTAYLQGRSLAEIEAIPSQIEAVTVADVQRVAKQYLTGPSVVSIVAASQHLK